MTTQLLFLPTIAFASGVFAPGAKARFFLSGTSTPVTVYTDTDFLVPAASPLVADAAGRFVQIFYNGTSEIRCVITAADDTAIADIDPVGRSNSTGSAADDLSFTPITGNPATDVQAAIAANTTTGIANAADIATNAADIAAIPAVIDEDDFATDSATRPPSQQSVKAYADAVAALGLGVGQTWQDVSGSRVAGTSYQNTTGRPIMVSISLDGSNNTFDVSTDNTTWVVVADIGDASGDTNAVSTIIPNGHYYRLTGTPDILFSWTELR